MLREPLHCTKTRFAFFDQVNGLLSEAGGFRQLSLGLSDKDSCCN